MAKRFNVEIIDVETGQETSRNYMLEMHVLTLVRQMKAGDSLVINRTEDSSSGLSAGGQL